MTEDRLLIVDDELDFAAFVARVGRSLGHTVEIAATPEAFKELCVSFSPTIVVVDIVMPQIDGIELIQWLVKHFAQCKIVAVSGADPLYLYSAAKIAQEFGVHISTLSKPIGVDSLKAALS